MRPTPRSRSTSLESLARTPVGRLAPRERACTAGIPCSRCFYAGYLAAARRRSSARRERSPRLAFAGDYLVGPYTEMALTSGMRAATEIARAQAARQPDP